MLAIGKRPNSYRYMAVCRCSCGSPPKAVRIDGLTSGAVVSCGCHQKKVSSTHKLSTHPLYPVWRHMVQRCLNSKDPAYENYGGRGITVCDRWLSVENFVADMESGYSPELELDRINNDGNYEPGNCKWSTISENCDNRRNSLKITFNGKTQSLARWSQELGMSYQLLWDRLKEWGWPPERAFTTPPLDKHERMALARRAQGN